MCMKKYFFSACIGTLFEHSYIQICYHSIMANKMIFTLDTPHRLKYKYYCVPKTVCA